MAGEYNKSYQIQRAKFAEMAERYDDMANAMKEVTKNEEVPLSAEERNLLSVAYKNILGAKRSSWRIMCNIEKDDSNKDRVGRYKKIIESEIVAACSEVLELLDKYLISKVIDLPTGSMFDVETAVFYLKMKGDYYRYIAEIATDETKNEAVEHANEAYNKAFKVCEKELETTNPLRLGLALNYSVFHYEIMSDPKEACKQAKSAFEDATADLNSLPEDAYKDSALIMGLLSDNLTLWTGQIPTEEE